MQIPKDAMHQYKTAVEDDGLATYLISGDWQNPDQVKQIIIKHIRMPSLKVWFNRRCACRIGT